MSNPYNLPLMEVEEASIEIEQTFDKRKGIRPVPLKIEGVLNPEQIRSLRKMESFGWKLAFVRRPLKEKVIAVVNNTEENKMAVLEENGMINSEISIALRQ